MDFVPAGHYVALSLIIFGIGVVGVLTRRNAIVIMMSIELILNAANINFVVFSNQIMAATGQPNYAGHMAECLVGRQLPAASIDRCLVCAAATGLGRQPQRDELWALGPRCLHDVLLARA